MEFVKTADGSKTLYHDQVGEHYHSKHGAQQESIHVFLNTALRITRTRPDDEPSHPWMSPSPPGDPGGG
jgi:tRNA U34 5-methylaminomethyl-2-thiouridine-forming methyltransferase MnmC